SIALRRGRPTSGMWCPPCTWRPFMTRPFLRRGDPAPPRARLHNRPGMRELRIGLAQINSTVGDLDGNFQKILVQVEHAREMGVDVLAFPEMVITGYPPEDLLLKPSFIETAITRTRDLLPHTSGMTVIVGTVDRDVDLYNAAAVLHDGRWVG